MALNFPDNPGIGSVFVDTNSGFSYKWDGTVWNGFAGSSASQIRNLDDISSSFDGNTTTFALTKDSVAVSAFRAVQLRVVLGGATQTADVDYSISGSNIVFTTAPLGGLSCTITELGVALSLADPADGSVTPAKLSTSGLSWNTSGDVYISGVTTTSNGLVVGVGLTLPDNVKLNAGNDNDLQIVHDGSNSLIDGAGTGGVHLKSNTEIKFPKRTGSENILVGTADGSVAAFYDNTKRFETTDGGALVYGTVGAGQTALIVEGDIQATGDVTAVSFNGDLVGTAATTNSTGLHVVGVATVLNVNATNVTAGVVTATTFSGALSGNATSATTATTATNVTVADESSDTSCNVLFVTAATGNLPPKSGTNLTFNSSTGALTATSFVGNLSGNATGLSGTPNIDCGTGSFTGDVDIADKIVHTGDTNTAIRFPSTDTVTIETSGSEALRIDSSGNVGIGTTSPEYIFDARGSINISGSIFRRSADNATFAITNRAAQPLTFGTNDTERMRIDSSGRVGIGTTLPSDRLHLNTSDATSVGIRLSNTEGVARIVADSDLVTISADQHRFTTEGATERMRIDSSGNLKLSSDAPFLYLSDNDNNWIRGSSSLNAILVGTNNAEQMRIASSGNVGINETSPDSTLHVTGPSSGTILTLDRAGSYSWKIGQSSGSHLTFTGDTTERMRIGPSGQIGLGGANYGTSGQVITSNGSGSAPTWQDAAGGAWNLVTTVTASNATTVDFTNVIDSTYSYYMIVGTNLTTTANGSFSYYYKNGSTVQTTGTYHKRGFSSSGTSTSQVFTVYGNTTPSTLFGLRDNATYGATVDFVWRLKHNTGTIHLSQIEFWGWDSLQEIEHGSFYMAWEPSSSTTINGVRLQKTNNAINGTFKLYGLE